MKTVDRKSPFVAKKRFVRADGKPFWQFLDEYGIEYDKNHFPFITKHRIPQVLPVFDFNHYLKLSSRGAALGYLYQGLGQALDYVGPVLDMELKHGFNDHTDRHTLWVAQTGVELLQRSGFSYDGEKEHYDTTSELLMTLVGMTHDLGNFMDRKDHSTYSAWLMTRLFLNTHIHSSAWHATLYSILFHEEPVLKSLGTDLTQGMPLQWALVAADKMHVGRDRVGGRSFLNGIEKNALEDDSHILLNSLICRSTWIMSSSKFVWHLGFSVDQLEDKFARFTKGNKRIHVPLRFQKLFVNRGVLYRDTFKEMFSDLYIDRLHMAAQSIFLLFPYLTRFEVQLSDIDTRGKVGSGDMVLWVINRADVFKYHAQEKEAKPKFGANKKQKPTSKLVGWWARG